MKIIVSELNNMHATENPEVIFEISFDYIGDLIVDWRNRKARALVRNLAEELGLNFREDFKIGHTRVHDLPEIINSQEKLIPYLKGTLEEYVDIAELFIK